MVERSEGRRTQAFPEFLRASPLVAPYSISAGASALAVRLRCPAFTGLNSGFHLMAASGRASDPRSSTFVAGEQALEEDIFKAIAAHVALAAELVCVLCIAMGMIEAIIGTAVVLVRRQMGSMSARRQVWTGLAVWIILALEFALGADIVRSAIAPTWGEIGQLAAIAAIRTVLNFFLERDLEVFRPGETGAEPAANLGLPT